jgi:hypothetical protein
MSQTSQVLNRHGLPLVFAAVFVEQMWLPFSGTALAAGRRRSCGNWTIQFGPGTSCDGSGLACGGYHMVLFGTLPGQSSIEPALSHFPGT